MYQEYGYFFKDKKTADSLKKLFLERAEYLRRKTLLQEFEHKLIMPPKQSHWWQFWEKKEKHCKTSDE